MHSNGFRYFVITLSLLFAVAFIAIQVAGRMAGRANATLESIDTSNPTVAKEAPLFDRLMKDLIRFHGETPKVQHRAEPYPQLRKPGVLGVFEDMPANIALFRAINGTRHPWLDGFAIVMLYLGSGWIILPFFFMLAVYRLPRVWVLAWALILETALIVILKEIFSQPRPVSVVGDIYLLEVIRWGSFPSGDVAMAFVLAWVGMRPERWWWKVSLILYAVAVSYQRMYVGAHFPLDVITGAALGIACSEIIEWIFRWWKAWRGTANATETLPASAPADQTA